MASFNFECNYYVRNPYFECNSCRFLFGRLAPFVHQNKNPYVLNEKKNTIFDKNQ